MTAGPDDETLAFAARVFDLAREGGADELTGYLDAGLSPDLTNARGDTLLVLAAYHRQADVVAALLAHDADVARTNDRGQTALGSAVFRQDAGIVRALLAAGPTRTPAGRPRSSSPASSTSRRCWRCWAAPEAAPARSRG